MGQNSLKKNRRALRRTAREEKNNIVSRYMTENWDKVVLSTIVLIRRFNFKDRLSIAMTILFRPIKKLKDEPGKSEADPKSTLDQKLEVSRAQA